MASSGASEARRVRRARPDEGSDSCNVCLLRPRAGSHDDLLWRLDAFNKFLLAASPLPRVTAGIGREVCRALGFTRMAFVGIDWSTSRAKFSTGYGLSAALIDRFEEPFTASPWIEASVRGGDPAYTEDAAIEPALPMRYVRRFGVGPLVCVPVGDSSGPVGIMLLDRGGAPFTGAAEVMEAAKAVGESIGLALEAAGARLTHPHQERVKAPELTPRERQMLLHLNRGLSNKEISAATGLSIFTVRDYISGLLRCLDVTSRAAAVARAWELGLLGDQAEDGTAGQAEDVKGGVAEAGAADDGSAASSAA